MINSITIKNNKILLFKKMSALKKINILFGGNGVGKTTFLNSLQNNEFELITNNENQIYLRYTNSKNNFKNLDKPYYNDTVMALNQRYIANHLSEGQSIIYSLISFLDYVKEEANKIEQKKSIIVILDEVDSGLSAENINFILHIITDMVKEYSNIQFFISSNHYHFVYVFKEVMNMYNGKWTVINNYDEYFKLLSNNMVNLGKKRELSFLQPAQYNV